MSKSVSQLRSIGVLEPTVNVNNERFYPILLGGNQVNYIPFKSSSQSNQSATFNTPPPSLQTIVDRRAYLRIQGQMTIVGAFTDGNNFLLSGTDALRNRPLSSIIQTAKVTVNGNSFSLDQSDIIPFIAPWYEDDPEDYYRETFPSAPDESQDYQELVGSIENPLGSIYEGTKRTRGSFAGFSVSANTPTGATIQFDITEPVYISPFSWGKQAKSGFSGIKTMDWVFNYAAQLRRMWSHAVTSSRVPTGAFTVSTTFSDQQMLLRFVQPKILESIPDSISYSFYTIQKYPTQGPSALAPGVSGTIVANNIQLQQIPSKIYVFARRPDSLLLGAAPEQESDTFCEINTMSIQFGMRSGILAQATEEELYHISARNGNKQSWTQWRGRSQYMALGNLPANNFTISSVGSVACFSPTSDFGLQELECEGLQGNFQMLVQCGLTNRSTTETYTPQLYVVVVNQGVFTLYANGSSYSQSSVVTVADILDAKESIVENEVSYEDVLEGGSFVSRLREGVKRAAITARKIYKDIRPGILAAEKALSTIPQAAPAVATFRGVREALGGASGGELAQTRYMIGENDGVELSDVHRKLAKLKKLEAERKADKKAEKKMGINKVDTGGAMFGGATMSRAELKARLRKD